MLVHSRDEQICLWVGDGVVVRLRISMDSEVAGHGVTNETLVVVGHVHLQSESDARNLTSFILSRKRLAQ